jgi:hypothetical protein
VKMFYRLVYFEGKKYFVDRRTSMYMYFPSTFKVRQVLWINAYAHFRHKCSVFSCHDHMLRLYVAMKCIVILTKLFLRPLEMYIACKRYVDY